MKKNGVYKAVPDDILLIDKPEGITSFDVIRVLRKKLGVRKMGHAGTLDPMATGLLIVGVGEGTKRMNEFLKLPKTYEAEVLFGVRTDTGDITGGVIEERSVEEIDERTLARVARELEGVIELSVPAYSAVKQGGEALYKKARRGERVAPPRRKMIVNHAELGEITRGYKDNPDAQVVHIHFDVGSGTYIRSLAEEIGRRMNIPTTLCALRRTQIGEFRVEDAKKLGDFE